MGLCWGLVFVCVRGAGEAEVNVILGFPTHQSLTLAFVCSQKIVGNLRLCRNDLVTSIHPETTRKKQHGHLETSLQK